MAAYIHRTTRNPSTTVSRRRSDAMIGGTIAFSTAIAATLPNAPAKLATDAPGTSQAATERATVEASQAIATRSGRGRGRTGVHLGTSPCEARADVVTFPAPAASTVRSLSPESAARITPAGRS